MDNSDQRAVDKAIEAFTNGAGDVADAIERHADMVGKFADAVTPRAAAGGSDASGAPVACLTEAVMGMTNGLMEHAKAINETGIEIAEALAGPLHQKAQDATGGHVGSLVEGVMGITAGLMAIATAIDGLTDAVQGRNHG